MRKRFTLFTLFTAAALVLAGLWSAADAAPGRDRIQANCRGVRIELARSATVEVFAAGVAFQTDAAAGATFVDLQRAAPGRVVAEIEVGDTVVARRALDC